MSNTRSKYFNLQGVAKVRGLTCEVRVFPDGNPGGPVDSDASMGAMKAAMDQAALSALREFIRAQAEAGAYPNDSHTLLMNELMMTKHLLENAEKVIEGFKTEIMNDMLRMKL